MGRICTVWKIRVSPTRSNLEYILCVLILAGCLGVFSRLCIANCLLYTAFSQVPVIHNYIPYPLTFQSGSLLCLGYNSFVTWKHNAELSHTFSTCNIYMMTTSTTSTQDWISLTYSYFHISHFCVCHVLLESLHNSTIIGKLINFQLHFPIDWPLWD